MTEVAIPDRLVDQSKVVELFLKGENPTVIARTTGFKRVYVLDLIDEYKAVARSDGAARDHAREMLSGMAEHYSMLIKKAYAVAEEAELEDGNDKMMKLRLDSIKLVAQLEKDRLDAFHRAGLMDDAEMADEIAETEAKLEAIKKLLLDVTANCPHCKLDVVRGLQKIFQEPVEVIKV